MAEDFHEIFYHIFQRGNGLPLNNDESLHFAPPYMLAFLREHDRQSRRPFYYNKVQERKVEEKEELDLPDFEK